MRSMYRRLRCTCTSSAVAVQLAVMLGSAPNPRLRIRELTYACQDDLDTGPPSAFRRLRDEFIFDVHDPVLMNRGR